jgi:hypothetical protein
MSANILFVRLTIDSTEDDALYKIFQIDLNQAQWNTKKC